MSFDLVSQLDASFANKAAVDIITFAESEEFCGKRLYPRQKILLKILFLMDLTPEEEEVVRYWERGGRNGTEIEISPYTLERMKYLKENGYPHFREIVLVGGRRSSKGFLTGLCLAYKVYQLTQFADPGAHFGIDSDKEIFFSVVAAAQDQAAEQQYADFASTINSCVALQPYLFKLQELEFSVMTERNMRQLEMWKQRGYRAQRLRDISTIRGKALPANSRTIRGSATMGICFDEVGHFLQGESDQSDAQVYSAAVPALAQFGRHGIIFLNSSPYSKSGILYEHFNGAMEVSEEGKPVAPTAFTMRFPSWAFYENWWDDPTFSGNKCIQCNPDWDPDKRKEDGSYFYAEDDRYGILTSREEERKEPDKFKVEYRGQFAEVLDAYLNPEAVNRMFAGIPNEEGIGYTPLETNTRNSSNTFQYRAHLDPSSTTAGFAFALGHTEYLTVAGREEEHVVFDILKRWDPADFDDSTIDWEPILAEIMFWTDIFRPTEITVDCHQSAMPIKYLQKEIADRNLGETRVYKKDANSQLNWNRAEVFKTALYRGLVHAPHDTRDSEWFELELKNLQVSRGSRIPRVAHPDVGPVQTDDCYDAVAHVVEAFVGNKVLRAARESLGIPPSFGAQGGYAQRRVTPRPFTGGDGEPIFQGKGAQNKKLAKARGAVRPRGSSPIARPFPR